MNQIVTDPELVERSQKLEEALTHGNYADYCRHKADQMSDQHNRYVWYFIKANFEQSPRGEMLNLLGILSCCHQIINATNTFIIFKAMIQRI